MASPRWEYYLDKAMDGKAVGWHPFAAAAATRLEAEYQNQKHLAATTRQVWHLQSGAFKYEVHLGTWTQRNMKTGTERPIRRVDPDGTVEGSDVPPVAPPTKKLKTSQTKTTTPTASSSTTSLALEALFAGAEAWEQRLLPVLLAQPAVAEYCGSSRDAGVVPARELTFQALKANPPDAWRVIVFGQTPYPRAESASGIAFFDMRIKQWRDSAFGTTQSMRCIIAAAATAKYGVPKQKIPWLRERLARDRVVAPAQWFQAMLTQGVLLLNAALTVGGNKTVAQHAAFWKPVVADIVDEIFKAKVAKAAAAAAQDGASSSSKKQPKERVLMLWWGQKARDAARHLDPIFAKYSTHLDIVHVDHYNPAANGDIFCTGGTQPHLAHVNERLGGAPIDWLPTQAWLAAHPSPDHEAFIHDTQQLHQLYLERLQEGLGSTVAAAMMPINGISTLEVKVLPKACESFGLQTLAQNALSKAAGLTAGNDEASALDTHEAGALYLYTGNALYKRLNEALRNPDRARVVAYYFYLRRFLVAFDKLRATTTTRPALLYRGMRGLPKAVLDTYKVGTEVTWWAVSSCTPNLGVATGFAGGVGGTLFHVQSASAVPIMHFSQYKGEEEWVLAPGTQFTVVSVTASSASSPTVVVLHEIADKPRLVA